MLPVSDDPRVQIETFGRPVLVTRTGIPPQWITGIFDEVYSPAFEGAERAGGENRRITLMVAANDAILTSHGSQVEIGSRRFKVIGVEPITDGQIHTLVLQEVTPF